MCAGPEVLAAAQVFGAVTGGLTALKSLTASGPSSAAPEVVRTNPVADDTAAQTKSAQDAEAQKLATRQRARQNSLLSQAGGAGDLSTADTTRGAAKAALGA